MVIWRCSKVDLNTAFLFDVEEFLEASPYTWYVLAGFRSFKEQAELYKKYLAGGPKAAPPGKSAHNFGLAVDVVLDTDPVLPGLQPSWSTKLKGWAWLKTASIKHPRLKNGWSFHDWPHIERYNWKKFVSP